MHRVHTRIRRMPPLIIARTSCRLGSNRRGRTLLAWLWMRPTTGVFPQTSHCLAMMDLEDHGANLLPPRKHPSIAKGCEEPTQPAVTSNGQWRPQWSDVGNQWTSKHLSRFGRKKRI